MGGGLVQLTAVGAQNQLVNGNPDGSFFTTYYKRATNFSMEHFQCEFRGNDQNLPLFGTKTIRAKLKRYGDLIHDIYLCVSLPDIYSGVFVDGETALPYEFQWIPNIGFNMIQEISTIINGIAISTYTGEHMKLNAATKETNTRRPLLNEMVGNVPDMVSPGGDFYPTAIAPAALPSIRGRQLTIPLPFWFCEEIGQSLPLVALPVAEVEISVTFTNIYSLFTILDPTVSSSPRPRISGSDTPALSIQNFLSAPGADAQPLVVQPNWNLAPYLESNFIFLDDDERAYIASKDHVFLLIQPRSVVVKNEYGYNNFEIPMFNLCTRILAVFSRTDLLNEPDNYVNIQNVPASITSGQVDPLKVYTPDILQEAKLTLDGADRFSTKNSLFFRNIQNYKYSTGDTTQIPGIYQYSFALMPTQATQPSGSINGSIFNKIRFAHTLSVPPTDPALLAAAPTVCVLKSTVFNNVPTIVNSNQFSAGETLTLNQPPVINGMPFKYNGIFYVESINFLKVTGGLANLLFST